MRNTADADKVRAYLARLPPGSRRALGKLRTAIRAVAPRAVASISYGILVYKLDGRMLVYCAGWKSHVSLYPLTAGSARALGADAGRYKSSKATLRFPLTKPVPVTVVKRFVKARVAEVKRNPRSRRAS